MSKKIPWWRKPYDNEDDYEDNEGSHDELEKRQNKDKAGEVRNLRGRPAPLGRRRENDSAFQSEFFRSSFDDEFDRFFSRSPFMDFEQDMENMHERMDRIMKQAMEGNLEKRGKGGPFVYGFSMRTGPDGVPHVQEFGNMSPEMMRRFRTSDNTSLPGPGEVRTETSDHALPSRQPLTDIMEHDDHITITLELPGVEKKDINLEIEDDALVVNVDTDARKYFKKLPLPAEVEPKSIDASFNNGVLDVNVKRLEPKPKKGEKIEVK